MARRKLTRFQAVTPYSPLQAERQSGHFDFFDIQKDFVLRDRCQIFLDLINLLTTAPNNDPFRGKES